MCIFMCILLTIKVEISLYKILVSNNAAAIMMVCLHQKTGSSLLTHIIHHPLWSLWLKSNTFFLCILWPPDTSSYCKQAFQFWVFENVHRDSELNDFILNEQRNGADGKIEEGNECHLTGKSSNNSDSAHCFALQCFLCVCAVWNGLQPVRDFYCLHISVWFGINHILHWLFVQFALVSHVIRLSVLFRGSPEMASSLLFVSKYLHGCVWI